MTSPTPSDRELLSAYLSDDLEAEAARELEARLAEDPALAAELDGMAEMLAGLQGPSEVEPPAGYEDRLRVRLAREKGPGVSRGDSPTTAVADLATVRRRRWPAVASAAAAVLLVVVVGAGVLGELPFSPQPQSGDSLSEGADDDAGVAERSPPERDTEAAEQGEGFDEDTAAAPEPEAAPGEADAPEAHQPGPVVLDDEVALADEAAVRRRHGNLPEAQRLLGQPVGQARDTATRFRGLLADAPPFRSGVRPDACLDEVADTPEGGGPRVPARVETVVYADRPALAYVLVEPSSGSERLDRVVTRLVGPRSCQTRGAVLVSR